MRRLLFTVFVIATNTLIAQTQQKIEQLDSVQLDTKIKIPRKNSGKVIATITQETLKNNPGKSVAQLVNEVSGIEINGNQSNEGQNLGYYIRGGRNRQVVIMVDGVQLTDPSQIANDYDLRLIPAASIENIEIIKGASSVLYGSGAATAVISITTKKASRKPIAATFTSTFGSNRSADEEGGYNINEFSNYVGINGTLKQLFYNISFGNRYVDGLSAVAAAEGEDALEEDVFNRFNGRINLGYNFNKNIKISQFFSFDDFKTDFDNFDYTDAENRAITKQLKTGGHFEWKYSKGKYVFNDNYTWIQREIESGFPAKYDSDAYSLDNYLTYNFTDEFTALLGLNYINSSFNSFSIPFGGTNFEQAIDEDTAKFDIIDPYLNFTFNSDFGLNLNGGVRLNIHSDYGNHLVYNVNPSYNFSFGKNLLKVLGSYSTAYITPSLFQLYDPLYGNEELQPEENTTLEGGLEFSAEGDLRISAIYFNRDEENYVDFINVDPDNFIFQYQNTSEAFKANGIEIEIAKRFGNKLNVTANYTNTKADERFALRIPEHKINANLGYQLSESSFLGLSYQFNSDREDSFFNPDTFENENVTLESYSLIGLTASHQISKNIKLFANVSNLLDEEFEELYGFQTRGRNMRFGFTLSF
tara:strand:- start:36026 stop:37954 length:1929 start_codon:yes stop_codon:yes gene_type:complete